MADPDLERFYSDLAALDVTGLQGSSGSDGANDASIPMSGANGIIGAPGASGATNLIVPPTNYFNGNPGLPGQYTNNQKQGLTGRNGTNGASRNLISFGTTASVNSTFTATLIYTGLYYVYFSNVNIISIQYFKTGIAFPYLTTQKDFRQMMWLNAGDSFKITGALSNYNTWGLILL